jgi:urea transport system substrate-binding protein
LMRTEPVDAVVGWHISAVREALVPAIPQHVPYVYTAVYEGGSHRPGVFCAGETPENQVGPALCWLARERNVRRWVVVGNDYIWPRRSAAATRELLRGSGAEISGELYVPLGTEDFSEVLRCLEASGCDGALMFLVGMDAVMFNRQFAASGLDEACVRFSPLMEENVLLGSGPDGSRNLFAAAGYFEALATPESLEFGGRYAERFGADAPPLNSPGESCYEGVRLLAHMVRASKTWDARGVASDSQSLAYEGPRGRVGLRRGHLQQAVYMSEADGVGFNVLCRL